MTAPAEPRERPALTDLLEATSPAARARAEAAQTLPVQPELATLLPHGGLQRGTVAVVRDPGLLLALAAGPAVHRPDVWTAAVALPDLGLAAAAGYGIDLDRLLLADTPGDQWPDVCAGLLPAVEILLLGPVGPSPATASRLGARLRQHGTVLLTPGPWPGAHLQLDVAARECTGLGDGHGQLMSRRVHIRASGRGAPGAGRTLEVLLPDERGTVTAVDGGILAAGIPDGVRAAAY
jgi:hypothetical protein